MAFVFFPTVRFSVLLDIKICWVRGIAGQFEHPTGQFPQHQYFRLPGTSRMGQNVVLGLTILRIGKFFGFDSQLYPTYRVYTTTTIHTDISIFRIIRTTVHSTKNFGFLPLLINPKFQDSCHCLYIPIFMIFATVHVSEYLEFIPLFNVHLSQ